MTPSTDGTITFNATEVYQRLALLTGAIRGMVTELQQSGQWPIADRLGKCIDEYGIDHNFSGTPHVRPASPGRPTGQQNPATGKFTTAATKKKVH